MTRRVQGWLVAALAGAVPLWPAAAPGQAGAPIPLLPPATTTPPARQAPSPQGPAAPYQLPPPTPYQASPATPYQPGPPAQYYAAPPTPYQAAPYQAPPAPYQEAPETPPPEQQAPIVTTPLAPPNPPPLSGAPAASATPASPAPSASAPGASAAASPQAPAQAAQTPPAEQPAGPQPAPPPYPNDWVPAKAARLVVLDKIDSLSKDLTVSVGQSASYGALTITVQSCMVRPPTQPANATAFLVISDNHKDEPGFRGWTLANDPWLSMLQNPVYDVWVMGCQS